MDKQYTMEFEYSTSSRTAVTAWMNFYDLICYNRITLFAITLLFPGLLSMILSLWDTGHFFTYISYLLIGLFILLSVFIIISRAYTRKDITAFARELETCKTATYVFEPDSLKYHNDLMQLSYNWSLFKGFFVYKGCVYILPKNMLSLMFCIDGENLKDGEIEACLIQLGSVLEKLPMREAIKRL